MLEKRFLQGAARSPEAWNHTIAGPLADACARIDGILRPAIPWSAEFSRWSLLLWAGNLSIFAVTWQQGDARGRAYEVACREVSLGISPWSVKAAAKDHACPAPEDARIAAVPIQRSGTLVCQGVALDKPFFTDTMVAHRPTERRRAFGGSGSRGSWLHTSLLQSRCERCNPPWSLGRGEQLASQSRPFRRCCGG